MNRTVSCGLGMESFENLEKCFTKRITDGDFDRHKLSLLYNNRGHARYMQVEFDEAIEDYNRAIEINPELGVAYYNRATVLYRLGSIAEACKDMKEAVNLEPSNLEFHQGLEECERMQKVSQGHKQD